MNELNYATLPASKRLVEAGIWLETECYWRVWPAYQDVPSGCELVTAEEKKRLQSVEGFDEETDVDMAGVIYYPAPCMAEVWRELPNGCKLKKYSDGNTAFDPSEEHSFDNANPTDALIDLLIWVRKEGSLL